MSVLPFGRITELSTAAMAPVQRPAPVQPVMPQAAAMAQANAADLARFSQQAAASAAAAGHPASSSRRDADASLFLRQADVRQIVRHTYRMGRLRGQHAAFDMVGWQGEIAKGADKLAKVHAVQYNLREMAEREQPDPFQRYLMLLEARERAVVGPDRDEDAIARLDAALDATWNGHAEEILAGFNTAPALMRFAEQIDEWTYFRQVYASVVLNGEALAATFKSLLKRFGASRLRRAIKALRDAIAADLASPYVSADRARLTEYQRDLEGTHTISSLVADSDTLCRRLAPQDTTPERVMDFVGGVFDFVGFNAYADYKLTELCGLIVHKDMVTEKERGQVREFLRQHVPLGLWSSLAVRENVFPAMFRPRP